MSIPHHLLRKIVEEALEEDIGFGDITTESIVPNNLYAKALIIGKEEGIIAGIPIAEEVFKYLDPSINFSPKVLEGERIEENKIIVEIYGKAKAILTGERTALNFLQRLSGIATFTNYCVSIAKPYGVKILDTRKTTPLLRILEKYAVKIGGGENHRFALYDMVLIKDNHIKIAGSITEAIKRVRERVSPFYKIEVETENLEQVEEALENKVDIIMLDNMDIETIKKAVEIIKGRALIEVSGNIKPEDIKNIAPLGINFISMGKLTHSVKSLDLSLEVIKVE
ncbi:MAG: carboxylating nicotinate-nucleotide diphosphorylase [Dictyoglomus sp.]|nr:carboxylating nicotinate-nucleotide diphosphorylase [Dictyoglomus sp.]MDW8188257.1 carboxylating nicotinate-nucleotide diphosphorylase [Dictyoglomus sp.]